jgi:hypothetical protein
MKKEPVSVKRECSLLSGLERFILKKKKAFTFLFLIIFIFATFYFCGFHNMEVAHAAARTASVSGNWSDTATWGGQSVPVLGDTVVINDGINVTVDTAAACDSLIFTATNTSNAVTISGSNSLTITNALTLPSPSGASQTETVNVGAGTLSAGSVSLGGVGSGRNTTLLISTGTVTVSGNITSAGAASRIIFSGAGTLNAGGTFLSGAQGTFTPSTGTVNFNAAGAQAIAPFAYTFNNVTLSNSGIKTTTNATINSVLSLEGTATASAAPTYGASATLKYDTATPRTAGAEWITPFVAGGGVIIANTGTITFNAAKVFNATSLLTIESGATLSMSTFLLTLNSDCINNGGTLSGTIGGVTLAGTADQSIGAFTTTGTVSMTKTAGTATFVGNVNGAGLTINVIGGTLNLGAGLTHTFTSTWTRTAGTLNGGSSTLKLTDGFSGTGGTFTANTGTVEYNANGIQTFPALTYNNLTLSGAGVKTVATTPTVNGVLSMEGTATITVTTGVVTYGAGATLQYNTASVRTVSSEEWISPFAANGGVIISNTGIIIMDTAKVFNDSVPLTINSGATLATNNFQLTLGGNFVNSGGIFNAGSSNIVIGPGTATQSISGFTTTGGVTSSKSGGVATMTGNMNASSLTNSTAGGTLHLGAGLTHTLTGGWTRTDGILDGGSSTLNIGGTVTNTAGTFTAGTSTVNYTDGAQTTANVNYYNLTLSGSGAKTLGASTTTIGGNLTFSGTASATGVAGLTIGGDVTIGAGTAFTAGAFTHNVAGNWTNNGGTFTNTGSTINLNGSSAKIIGGSASTTFNNLTINNAGGISASINSTVNGVLNLQSANPSATMGSLDLGANTLTMGGSATTIGAGDVTGIVKRTTLVAGTLYTFGNQYTTINFRNLGTLPTEMSFKTTIGSAPSWKADGIQRIYDIAQTGTVGSGSFATLNLHYLDSELNGNTENDLVKWFTQTPLVPGSAIEYGRSDYDTTNNWVGTSAFDVSLWPTGLNQSLGTLGDSVLALSGVTWNGSISAVWSNPGNWTPNGIPADLADVTIPDASTTPNDPALNPALAVGRLTLQSGAILNGSAGSVVTVSGAGGAWSNNGGTFNASTGEVIFTNAAATISGATNFYDVTINPGADVTMGSGGTMRIGGTMTNNGTWRAAQLSGTTVEYNGASQTVLNPNGATPGYDNLILSGSGTKTLPAANLDLRGDFTNNGITVGVALNTITLKGSTGAQTIGGTTATTFNNLTIDNSAGATISSVSPTIDGVLTLTSGNITTGANNVYISSTGSVSGGSTASHVVGNLRKWIALADAGKTFEIGDATNYTPVDITNATVGTVDDLTVTTTAGQHPNFATSNISLTKNVNRYWSFTAGGSLVMTYDSTFNFVAGDVIGGATPANLIVGNHNAGWTYPTVGTTTATSTQATGLSIFHDFALGEFTGDISAAGVTGFVAPATGAVPQAFGSLTPNAVTYSVTGLTWAPIDNPYLGGQAYTATVVLTSAVGYKFPVSGIAVPTADGGGTVSAGTTGGGDVSGNTLTYTVLFPATAIIYATAPTPVNLTVGGVNPVGGITNVAIPVEGGTDSTGAVTGWITGTADTIKFTVTDNGAATSAITINAAPYVSGADYTIAAATPLTIVVTTSEAGKTNAIRTFTVTVTAVPSSDATLSNLTISAGTLIPVFISGTISYDASVTNGTASVTVTPTSNHAGATITVNGAPVASGAASGAIALSVGSNTITVLVTAEDSVTTKTYTIAVARDSAGGGGGGSGYMPPATVPAPVPTLLSTGNYSANEAINLSTTINIDQGATPLPAGAISPCLSNSLIKLADDHNPLTQSDSAVYYCGADGRRYVFPNPSTYFSWYTNFNNIQIISENDLAAISLGANNATIRPGTRLVKFQTSHKVYAVAPGGALRWIADEKTAAALYGPNWNKWVLDISDAFFSNYHITDKITLNLVTPGSSLPPDSLLVIPLATPAPAPVTTQCHSPITFFQDLKLNSNGSEVLELQKLLQCLGYFPENIVANGNFGLVTETATKKFQSANNLDSLGYVGVATRKVLNTY